MFEVKAIPDNSTFANFTSCNLLTWCVQVEKALQSSLVKNRLKGSIMHEYRSIAQLVIISARGQIISLRTLTTSWPSWGRDERGGGRDLVLIHWGPRVA